MYIYIALNSSTNNRRCSSYITYNYSSLSNLYSTFCLYIAINLCVIRKNSLALELPVIEPLTVSFPLHVTLPSTVPNKSIEPNESRSPFIESPSVITAVSSAIYSGFSVHSLYLLLSHLYQTHFPYLFLGRSIF